MPFKDLGRTKVGLPNVGEDLLQHLGCPTTRRHQHLARLHVVENRIERLAEIVRELALDFRTALRAPLTQQSGDQQGLDYEDR